jgi:hypothetical protein
VSTRRDLSQARSAISRGRGDEALVILWNLVEPARLEGDERTLRAIGALAAAVARHDEGSRREAERLLESLGRVAPARPEPEPAVADLEEEAAYEPLPPEPPASPSPLPGRVEEAGYGEIELPRDGDTGPPAETEPQAPQRGLGRWIVPIVALIVIVVNVIARALRDD